MSKNGFEIFELILSSVIRCFKWIVLACVVLLVLSGVYTVNSGECAVVLRFGRLQGKTYESQVKQPGLHFALPNMIDEVIKVPVERIMEMEITTHYKDPQAIDPDVTKNGYIITGDKNLVLIDTKIKYHIDDPVKYALYVGSVDGILESIVCSELNTLCSSMTIDEVLTTGRSNLVDALLKNANQMLDEDNYGVALTNVEFMDVTPPGETKAYFEAVNSASVGKQTLVQEATDYKTQKILEAQSQSDALVAKSRVAQSKALSTAKDEMAEFDGLYAEYTMNPDVVLEGVFRERVSTVLSRMGATLVMPDYGSPILYLP